MDRVIKEFDHYQIYYMTGGNDVPLIDCYDGTTPVGKLVFHTDPGPLPPNVLRQDGVIYLRYRIAQFRDVLNILRGEKPLYIRIGASSLIGGIGTAEGEPVGKLDP